MIRASISTVFSLFIITGCASTYIIQKDDPENYISKINSLSKSYTSYVQLSDNSEFETNSLLIENDTLYVLRNGHESIPIELVSTIKLRDVARGFFDGVFMGLPIAVAATYISYKAMDDPNTGAGDLSGLGALLVGGIAWTATVIVNGIYSGNKTYIFKREENNSFRRLE
jgi:hypothetical protein